MPELSDKLKVPPHSLEAEQSVIGGVLIDSMAWDHIVDRVNEADFYRPEHRVIFSAVKTLAGRHQAIDVVTVSEILDSQKKLDAIGGLSYLAELVKNIPSAANITAYADIVRERAILRQLIDAGTQLISKANFTEGRTGKEILDEAEQLVFKIAEQKSRGENAFSPLSDYLAKVIDRIDYLYQQGTHITGLSTGFQDFDELTSGLQNSDLIVVAGRPSMGKTTFAMNIAENVAIRLKKSVAVFSMEMPGEQLAMRLISSLGRIDQQKLRSGKLDDDDWPRITSTVQMLAEAPIYIDDTPGLSPMDLRARVRRLKREKDVGMVVVDYLQLMQVPGSKENRTGEISEISRSLKSLAREMNVPVIALSQLNRSLEQRPNKRPVMSDLRESGAIEQDADVIVFIYRDEVYNENSESKGIAEIIISKQRNGPLGKAELTFLGKFTRFENIAKEYRGEGYS